jgi:hypothetical protein
MPNDNAAANPSAPESPIAYNPNQVATLSYEYEGITAKIETCQESLRQMYNSTMNTQRNSSFSVNAAGLESSSSVGSSGRGQSDESSIDPVLPGDAVTPPISRSAVPAEETGVPTGLEDRVTSAVRDGIEKGIDELRKLLEQGLRVKIEKKPGGGFEITASKLDDVATPTSEESGDFTVIPKYEAATGSGHSTASGENAVHLVTNAGGNPQSLLSIGAAGRPTQGEAATSSVVSSSKSSVDQLGFINTAVSVSLNLGPLINIQVSG